MNETIEFRQISKIYPPDVIALENISLNIKLGITTSIIGENGAGKSTLVKILYGLERPSLGSIFINSKEANISNSREAIKYSIGMVHQEFMLVDSYTVAENIVLGNEPSKAFGIFDKEKANEEITKLLKKYNVDIDANAIVSTLSIGAKQKVEIAKLLYRDVKILILDEPTAVLTPQESLSLFEQIKELKSKGHTILFISHKLDEVLNVSDEIVIMRKGKVVNTFENKNITKEELAKNMIGKEVLLKVDKGKANIGNKILEIKNLNTANKEKNIKNINFNIHSGEIIGIAGIEGNGQLELVKAIVGQEKIESGKIVIDNTDITNKPIDERRLKISYISEDRKNISSVQKLSLIDNGLMTHHRVNKNLFYKNSILKYFINFKKVKVFVEDIIKRFQVVANSPNIAISTLSGGNQQKFIIGREFMLDNNFILLNQPTRGLDILSIEYIHKEIVAKREQGNAILLISAELDEILSLSDRVLIFYKGEIVGEKITKDTNAYELGEYMLGINRDKV